MKKKDLKLLAGCLAACMIVYGCGSSASTGNVSASGENPVSADSAVAAEAETNSAAAGEAGSEAAEEAGSAAAEGTGSVALEAENTAEETTAVSDAAADMTDESEGSGSAGTDAAVTESEMDVKEETESAEDGATNAEDGGEEPEKPEPAEEDPDEGLLVIGEKAEGDHVYRIVFTNLSERNITELRIKDIYAGSYPDNMMPEGAVFANGERAVLYFDASPEEAAESTAESSGTESSPADEPEKEYTIRVTFDNGKMKDMTSFPFGDMTEAELYFDEDLLHAVYTSIATGEVTDTSGREKALRGEAQRAKEEAARAAASAGSSGGHSAGTNTGGANECIDDDKALTW